jgi:two-component system chemotaxis response regulator CheB
LPVRHAEDCAPLLPGQVLIAPPDLHLTVEQYQGQPRARLWHGPKENYTRPAIDPLFRSAAEAFDGHVIATVLTGYLDDGTAGLQAVKACGGYAVVQDPNDAQVPDMPTSALSYVSVDRVLPLAQIGPLLATLASEAAPAKRDADRPNWITVENRYIRSAAGIAQLQEIGVPSTYTCPECSGALWQIKDVMPPRFRCHTGHSFSACTLSQLQDQAVENMLWSSVRALQERTALEQELLGQAAARQDLKAAQRHANRIRKAETDIAALHASLERLAPKPSAAEPD